MSDIANTTDSHKGSGSVQLVIEGAKNVQNDIHTLSQTITNSIVYVTQGQELGEPEIKRPRMSSTPSDTSHLVLKEKLQQLYERITLPTVAWLEEGSELSMDKYFVKLHLNQSNVSIEASEIFNPVNSKKPLRILLEGQPGFGKTTLASKLAYDWAKNEEYIKHFELVLFMSLRELHGRSIEKQIEKIRSYCGYQQDDIVQTVNSHKSDILFILDGLDEVNSEERPEIINLLSRKTYKDATVVVTCRTGLVKFSTKERIISSGLSNVNPNFSDKRVLILGIKSVEEKRKFLTKCMPQQTQMVENILENLSQQLELFDSPLFLIFLPVMIEEDEDMTQFSTRTQLFKKLFNACIKHSYGKRKKQIDLSFDLFCLNGRPTHIQKQIQDFGILSMQKILKSEFKYESDDVTKEIYEFGLLINHQKKKLFTSKNHYEGLHLSLLEFASAFALCVDLTLNSFADSENLLQEIVHHFLDSEGTSLVLPFLAGLMQENLDLLLSKIKSFRAWFSLDFRLTGKLMSECSTQNIHTSKCLINFIPSRTNDYVLSEVFLECVKYGIESEKIKTIDCHALPVGLISKNEIGTCLRLRLRPKSGLLPNKNKVELTVFSSVPCQKPQSFFRRSRRNGTLRNWLRFAATSTSFDSCELLITSSTTSRAFLKYIDNVKPFTKIKYRRLTIKIKTKVTIKLLTNLLANNQVQTLILFLDPELTDQDMSRFASAAGQSTYLTSLEMIMNGTIDLYDLTNGGQKKYVQFSVMGNGRLTCRQPISSKNCFNILGIDNLLDNIELISALEPMTLDCNTRMENFLSCLNANEHLFSKLTSLRTLVIHIVHGQLPDFEKLARGILSLPIVELIIIDEFTESGNLFKCMNDIMKESRSNCHLTTIILCAYYFPRLSELIKGLERKHWNKVCLVSEFKRLSVLCEVLSNFNVTHDHDTNIDYLKPIIMNHKPWDVDLLSITRK